MIDAFDRYLLSVKEKKQFVDRQHDNDWAALVLAIALAVNNYDGEITAEFLKEIDDKVYLDDVLTVRDGSVFKELERVLEKYCEEQEE